jgi:Photoprotection regulator fluorescence recovery protein
MRDFTWSPSQKKAARAAFDIAILRELKATRQEVELMLQNSQDDRVIWRLHDYLSDKRREIDQKYDYRYSVLMLVFPRLVSEGWLKVEELAGIGSEKVEVINTLMELRGS